MIKQKGLTIAILLLCTCLVLSAAQASEWNEVINDNGVVLSQRILPGKAYQQNQGSALIQGKIDSLLVIMENTALCSQWLNNCRSSKTVKRTSPTERIDYTVMDAPFLLEDRDMYIRSTISYDSQRRIATIQLHGLENYDAGQTGRVRVKGILGHWRFQQLNDQQVKVDYLMYSNPQITPASAFNASSPKGAFKTFTKLLKLAASAKFRNAKLNPARLKAITVR